MDEKLIQLNITAKNMDRICSALFIGPVLLYLLVNIVQSGLGGSWYKFISVDLSSFILTLLMIYIFHEALHVAGGLLIGAKFSSFSFGFHKPTLSIECGCQEEMSTTDYQLMLLLPFVVLTPLLAGLILYDGAHLWWIMLALSTSGCAFDLTVSLGLIGIPGQTRIIPELEGKNGYVYVRSAQ